MRTGERRLRDPAGTTEVAGDTMEVRREPGKEILMMNCAEHSLVT